MSVKKQDNKYAIGAADVTRVCKLYEKPIDHLKESVSTSHKNYHRDFYALNQLSFRVKKRETVGIIGTSGPGKSTILEATTRVLTLTTGEVKVDGKISALLELGTGFNMDYIGIENMYMNGTMMGYTKKEMDAKLQDILEFVEIGDPVHQPVKTYSNGMSVWLAFTSAINVNPGILIADEALFVGDVLFQLKCYRGMKGIRQKGTTILMVAHDTGSITKCCNRVVLLNKGEFITEDLAGRVVGMYKKILAGQLDPLKAELEREKRQKESLSGGNGQGDTGNGQHTRAGAEGEKAARNQAGTGTKSGDVETSDFFGGMGLERSCLMKDQLTINYGHTEYGDSRAEIVDLGFFSGGGDITNLLLKGEIFTIKEWIHFNTEIRSLILTYTIKDKKGVELTGTSTMFEGTDIQPMKYGDEHVAEFTQKMTLQGGEYLLGMDCIGSKQGERVVYHRLYNVINITVTSNKNTAGVYGMESKIRAEKVGAGNTQTDNVCLIVNGEL